MSLDLVAPQPLTSDHHCIDFSCGEPVLDEWLKRRAMANQISGASRTFVAADKEHRVYGYCIDPAVSAQVRPLMQMPQREFSCSAPDADADGCKSQSSPR